MIQFSKMHGLGNDFVVINAIDQFIQIDQLPIQQIADRHLGIGFDQLLIISSSMNADFYCHIFNADSTQAEQCGNGLRCIARFIYEKNLSKKPSFTIETKGGIYAASILDQPLIQISMGTPCFEPEKIPFQASTQQKQYSLKIPSDASDQIMSVLSMGNPHAILEVASVSDFPVQKRGHEIGHHSAFPQGVNVGFMEIVDPKHIRLRTYERGAGETFACGSNACAAVVAGINNQLLDQKVKVELGLGNLWIEWSGKDAPVLMTGPAEWVFEGTF